jgi:hypothetical protein
VEPYSTRNLKELKELLKQPLYKVRDNGKCKHSQPKRYCWDKACKKRVCDRIRDYCSESLEQLNKHNDKMDEAHKIPEDKIQRVVAGVKEDLEAELDYFRSILQSQPNIGPLLQSNEPSPYVYKLNLFFYFTIIILLFRLDNTSISTNTFAYQETETWYIEREYK